VNFDRVVDAHAVFETTVGLRNDGRKTPSVIDFDLLDEVNPVRVIGSVQKGTAGLESRHPKYPPPRQIA